MQKFTVLELANVLGVDRDAAYNLVSYLEARGHIERDGKKKNEPGVRGRGQAYFKVKGDLAASLAGDVQSVLTAPEPVVVPATPTVVEARPVKAPTIPPAMAAELTAQAKSTHETATALHDKAENNPVMEAASSVLHAAASVLEATVAANQA